MNTDFHSRQTTDSTGLVSAQVNLESVPDPFQLLTQAAEVAAKAGIPPEAFMASAWQAYLRASPGLAEHLAEVQFDAALEDLRSTGRLAKA
jgi:uncharacterized protein YfaS (alpha-2-macroglobulin family)